MKKKLDENNKHSHAMEVNIWRETLDFELHR